MKTKTRILNAFRALFKNKMTESFLRSCIRLGFFNKLAPNHYQYKENTIRTVSINGIKMTVDISDYVGHYLYFGFKDVSFDGLLKLVKPGATILDIGANIGFTALSMSQKAGDKSIVYAFEPDPFNFKQLSMNAGCNPKLNVKLLNLGLGTGNEQLKLAINTTNNRGGNRIKHDVTENFSLVNIVKLDDFIEKEKIHNIDLIKIDVEGFEHNVLKGGQNYISKYLPALFIELDDNNLKEQNSSAKDFIEFLEQMGYTCKNSENDEPINTTTNFSSCHYDILCTKK